MNLPGDPLWKAQPTPSFRPLVKIAKPFLLVLLLALLLVVLAILLIRSLRPSAEAATETTIETALPQAFQFSGTVEETPLVPDTRATPTPTPASVPHGAQNFSVSNSNVGPKFSKGTLDPYDPAVGDSQTVTITIRDTNPVTSAEAILKTDNDSKTYPLALSSGTNLDGQWKGIWSAGDAYLRTYHLILTAKSDTGTSTVDITLR